MQPASKNICILSLLFLSIIAACTAQPIQSNAGRLDSAPEWAADSLIDIHGHIGSFAGFDINTETLISNIERYAIQMVLVSNIDGANFPGRTRNLDEASANQATADTVLRYPDNLRGILWARPNDNADASNLRAFLEDPRYQGLFVGIKFHPEMNQFEAATQDINDYMQLCQEFRLPAVFHAGNINSNSSPERIYTLAKRFPEVPIILYHMGFLGGSPEAIEVVERASNRRDADLYLGTAQATAALVMQAIQRLGSNRVLFGTDATYYGSNHYNAYRVMLDSLRRGLDAQGFRNVTHSNAVRLFRLNLD